MILLGWAPLRRGKEEGRQAEGRSGAQRSAQAPSSPTLQNRIVIYDADSIPTQGRSQRLGLNFAWWRRLDLPDASSSLCLQRFGSSAPS